jgi:hypothetical protein
LHHGLLGAAHEISYGGVTQVSVQTKDANLGHQAVTRGCA